MKTVESFTPVKPQALPIVGRPPDRARLKAAGLDANEVRECLLRLKKHCTPAVQKVGLQAQDRDVFRTLRVYREGGSVIDLGGGISSHNGVLAQFGMTVYVVDMLADYWNHREWLPGGAESSAISNEIELLEKCGIHFIHDEILTYDLTAHFPENSIDVVTSFHTLEHFHHSPKIPMESAMRVLKPGGMLLIEVPNAANLRKRLSLLCGRTNYEEYSYYYNSPRNLGHVREYTKGDLRELAQYIGATEYRMFGKNYLISDGMERALRMIPRSLLPSFDRALQALPGLCSCLFLEITKK